MLYVGVLGSNGRMGQALLGALENHPRCSLSIAGTRNNTGSLFEGSDVVIDFTTPDALSTHVDLSITHKIPIIVGTTGLTNPHKKLLTSAATKIPLVVASNMSIGMTLLNNLVQKAAHLLDDSYDIEISELHHRHKKDAPSGTSLMLGQSAAKGRGKLLEELMCNPHREGERIKGTIGFSVQRGGMVVGDHSVRFIGDEEMIELSHRGLSRNVFAKGALRAAEWVVKQKPGFYTMGDVLGL
jgi:4-hydroxy-tetrahydrodipicolinate reductase